MSTLHEGIRMLSRRTLWIGLTIAAVGALAGCAGGAAPTASSSARADDQQNAVVDEWVGSGGPWTLNQEGCVDGAVLDSGLALFSGSTPTDSCVYDSESGGTNAGYYLTPAAFATAQPAVDAVRETPELGIGARTVPQTIMDPEGCIVTVPLAGNPDYFLGVAANNSEQTTDESCQAAMRYLRSVATQGPYSDPPVAEVPPLSCELMTPIMTLTNGDEIIAAMMELGRVYFDGSTDAAYGWASQECGAGFE